MNTMTDRYLDFATIATATVQLGVAVTFFGALIAVSLLEFMLFPTPY